MLSKLRLYYIKPNYIIIPLLVTLFYGISGLITRSNMDWYATLTLPYYTPPKVVFKIIWPVIYILTTITMLFVWNKSRRNESFLRIIKLFVTNALLNITWIAAFFVYHNIKLGFLITLLLNLSTVALLVTIAQQSIFVSLCLVPYLLWGLFASYLNYALLTLN